MFIFCHQQCRQLPYAKSGLFEDLIQYFLLDLRWMLLGGLNPVATARQTK